MQAITLPTPSYYYEPVENLVLVTTEETNPITTDGIVPSTIPLVRLNWPLVSQVVFAPVSYYAAVRANE